MIPVMRTYSKLDWVAWIGTHYATTGCRLHMKKKLAGSKIQTHGLMIHCSCQMGASSARWPHLSLARSFGELFYVQSGFAFHPGPVQRPRDDGCLLPIRLCISLTVSTWPLVALSVQTLETCLRGYWQSTLFLNVTVIASQTRFLSWIEYRILSDREKKVGNEDFSLFS